MTQTTWVPCHVKSGDQGQVIAYFNMFPHMPLSKSGTYAQHLFQSFRCSSQNSCLIMAMCRLKCLSPIFDSVLESRKKFPACSSSRDLPDPSFPAFADPWVPDKHNQLNVAASLSWVSKKQSHPNCLIYLWLLLCLVPLPMLSALDCNSLAFWLLPVTSLLFCPSTWYNRIEFPVLQLGFCSQLLPRCLPCVSLPFCCLTLTCLALIGPYIQL